MSLPLLDAMHPRTARAASSSLTLNAKPRRMLGICNNLGLRPDLFFPTGTGRDYVASSLSRTTEGVPQRLHGDQRRLASECRRRTSLGHQLPDRRTAPGKQLVPQHHFARSVRRRAHRHLTRFPSLTLAVNGAARSLSWTGAGVAIPPEERASEVFNQLFLQGTPEQVEAQVHRLDTGRSILDAVADQAKELQRNVGARDRSRLEQYFTSVRDLEHRLQESRDWERKPKPVVSVAAPAEIGSPAQYMEKVKAMYDLARLAFETDSTRAITLMLNSVGTPAVIIPGETITDSYHNLSHHGKTPEKLAQLKVLDEWHMKLLANLFNDLKAVSEGGESLLDRTMILYGSNLGDANAHSTINLPTLFAGGGFHHGQHLAFDRAQNYPLPNLFVSMLQRMGLDENKFASSTGTMRGLEMT